MNIELSDDALTFGSLAGKALEAAGGDELLQRAERDPGERRALVEPVLGGLGAWDLNPREDADELEAAAALCRSAGWWAAPGASTSTSAACAGPVPAGTSATTRSPGAVNGTNTARPSSARATPSPPGARSRISRVRCTRSRPRGRAVF